MKHALVLTEARGQAIHLREDANVNLLQAGHLARRFAERGFTTRLLLILDGGQSPEEYSLLCHLEDDVVEGFRRSVALARDPARARRALVCQVRETLLPVTLRARHAAVADDLFFAPALAEVSRVHPRLHQLLPTAPHPLIDAARLEEYEALLAAHRGSGYLDLEEAVARLALGDVLRDWAPLVEVVPLRPAHDPRAWVQPPLVQDVVDADLREKEAGAAGESFHSRLIGLFPAVSEEDGRCYFNSPTSCRLEHGKARILPRDRFGILRLAGSERLAFPALRTLLDGQASGNGRRLVGIKYPYTARILARSVARQAEGLAEMGPVTVVFVEGSEGTVNPATGGLLDGLLSHLVTPFAKYRRFVARDVVRRQLPVAPGGLPLIQRALARLVPSSFSPPLEESLFAERAAPSAAALATIGNGH